LQKRRRPPAQAPGGAPTPGGRGATGAGYLSRFLIKRGPSGRGVITKTATRFITPLTLEVLTGHLVHCDVFDSETASEVLHIELAKWADIVLIAPATANIIGKIACGIADDLLSTIVMAVPKKTPVAVAPAMNVEMWNNPIVQKNVSFLESLGTYHIIQPVEGLLACGDVGKGKIADNELIVQKVEQLLSQRHGA
jgi:phosphopantothenoylcysteine synthetase/decarboxylase